MHFCENLLKAMENLTNLNTEELLEIEGGKERRAFSAYESLEKTIIIGISAIADYVFAN